MPKDRKDAAKLFRADLEAAGLAYRDPEGLVADFHALRHTFITNLARGGVHPKVAQSLARHSTIGLTMDRYTHTLVGEQAEALDALPDLSKPAAAPEAMRATGTEGKPVSVLADCLALSERPEAIPVGADGLPPAVAVESQSLDTAADCSENQGPGSVCTSGGGPGLQNQWGV